MRKGSNWCQMSTLLWDWSIEDLQKEDHQNLLQKFIRLKYLSKCWVLPDQKGNKFHRLRTYFPDNDSSPLDGKGLLS